MKEWTYRDPQINIQSCPDGSDGKESANNPGGPRFDPQVRKIPWRRELAGYPLQYFCMENPMDRGAWWATVRGVAKSWTQLSNEHSHYFGDDPRLPRVGEGKMNRWHTDNFQGSETTLYDDGYMSLYMPSNSQNVQHQNVSNVTMTYYFRFIN